MKDLPLRLLVAFIGIPVIVFAILKGGLWFFGLLLLIAALGQRELYILLKAKAVNAQVIPGISLGLSLMAGVQFGWRPELIAFMALTALYIFGSEMFRNNGSANLNIAGTVQGVIYPTAFLATLLFLRQHIAEIMPQTKTNPGGVFIFAIFLSVWACDTFAYFTGASFGKHKLFERVSPKKSIEGAVGGLVGAWLGFFLLRWIGVLDLPYNLALISGGIVGTIGQLGDLVESWFKRDAQIKDSGALLPGHGGVLDRFDSLIFIAPAFLILYFLW
jgi:phosphatidate cytidylyltransferase